MKNTHDNIYDEDYEKYKDIDFSDAKPVKDIPALARLQAENRAKKSVSIRLDGDIITAFKAKAASTGGSYQTLINDTLREALSAEDITSVIRKTIREELRHS
jgi:uncharacterized protein (DUF4415 family)